jgi:hypothetical protein
MFEPGSDGGTRFAALPHVEDQARVVGGQAAELGGGHFVLAKELLDSAD